MLSDHSDGSFCDALYSGGSGLPLTFQAVVQYDKRTSGIGWYVEDVSTKRKLVNMPKGGIRQRNAKTTKAITGLKPGGTYRLVMIDKTKRNGFVQGKSGFINIVGKTSDGTTIWSKRASGKFRAKKVILFTIPRF